jgi:hypothetical protein
MRLERIDQERLGIAGIRLRHRNTTSTAVYKATHKGQK